ncbi:MAG: hypothetical protein IMW86_04600 [Hydrogenibacillus sp.]|nr:hypothetical protein [Hydrogenibacillus sp.]
MLQIEFSTVSFEEAALGGEESGSEGISWRVVRASLAGRIPESTWGLPLEKTIFRRVRPA